MTPRDDDALALREAMVRTVARDVTAASVLEALREIPRHLFMPGASLERAYHDSPAAIGYGQTIPQPTIVGIMTEALDLSGNERVLEIGTGSGYQAAVLSLLAREVFSIEVVAPLADEGRERLVRLGYTNVHVRSGDGYLGWPEAAPFDRIVLTAALLPDHEIARHVALHGVGRALLAQPEAYLKAEKFMMRKNLNPYLV